MTQARHLSDEQLWSGGEAVDEHLVGCARCRARQHVVGAEQQAVLGWLQAASGLSTDQRMPDDVAGRLEEVVSGEASRRASSAVVKSLPAARARRRATPARPWLVAAAVAGAALVGGTLLVPALDRADLVADGGDDAGTALVEAETGAAGEAAVAPVPPIPPDVAEQAARRVDDAPLDSCGQTLAKEVGGAVVAATEVTDDPRGGVLVTLDNDGQRELWWLPSCESTPESAWGRDGPS